MSIEKKSLMLVKEDKSVRPGLLFWGKKGIWKTISSVRKITVKCVQNLNF